MDALTFLRKFKYDERLVTGEYFPSSPVQAESGETIGVVLMNMGGPNSSADIEPFLYKLFMDPVIIDIPLKGILRHWLCKYISIRRVNKIRLDYEHIGGGSPIGKFTDEQAQHLELFLNRRFGKIYGLQFRVYVAMRYSHPTSEEAAEQMKKDSVDKVVLLPLYPQYSKTTTGSSLNYWWMLEQSNEIPRWPTTYIYEYSTHPKYVQAISSRIDEALSRFPDYIRGNVQIIFSAHGTPLYEMKKRHDPYCCLVHSTVEQVMNYRNNDYPFHVSFQSKVGPVEWLAPGTVDKLKELVELKHKAVLIVPVSFVTDHIETLYELNVVIRQLAAEFGIEYYEITEGLNTHPLFIEALAEMTVAQLSLPDAGMNGKVKQNIRPMNELHKYCSEKRHTRCQQCEYITEAFDWEYSMVSSANE